MFIAILVGVVGFPLPRLPAQVGTPANLNAASGLPAETQQELEPQRPSIILDYDLLPSSTDAWSDAGVDLVPGDTLEIIPALTRRMEGRRQAGGSQENLTYLCDPSGLTTGDDVVRDLPVPGTARGALIARLNQRGAPFAADSANKIGVPHSGHLYLGANIDGEEVCDGVFQVHVRIIAQQNQKTAMILDSTDIEELMLDRLPRRTSDRSGHPGDMINLIFIGSQKKVRAALASAGWTVADRSTKSALMHAAATVSAHQDYTEMPMSELYLFGRVQDYGYEQAQPYKVMASRHHFRLWKVPWDVRGQPVLVAAATHDIGFEKNQRNGHLTHKIDPNVDAERDYVGASVQKAVNNASLTYFMPSEAVHEASTATGRQYYSDGRILVIRLE